MATALDSIKKSMRLFGAIGQNEEPTATESANALQSLNDMLEAWSIERLLVYRIQEEAFTWPSGQLSRTIGVGGNFNTTRPIRIENGFSRIDGIDYHYRVIDKRDYDSIAQKTTESSYPDSIYYDYNVAVGTIYAFPVPRSNIDFRINSWKQLQSIPTLTTEIVLPPGYKRAIDYNLAIEIQGEYPDLAIPDSVIKIAIESKASLKAINYMTMQSELGLVAGRRYNVFADI